MVRVGSWVRYCAYERFQKDSNVCLECNQASVLGTISVALKSTVVVQLTHSLLTTFFFLSQ